MKASGATPANNPIAPISSLIRPGSPAYHVTASTLPKVAFPPKPKLMVPSSMAVAMTFINSTQIGARAQSPSWTMDDTFICDARCSGGSLSRASAALGLIFTPFSATVSHPTFALTVAHNPLPTMTKSRKGSHQLVWPFLMSVKVLEGAVNTLGIRCICDQPGVASATGFTLVSLISASQSDPEGSVPMRPLLPAARCREQSHFFGPKHEQKETGPKGGSAFARDCTPNAGRTT